MRGAKSAPSIIAADLTVNGDVDSSGEIVVHGKVSGNVTAERVTVGNEARVVGDVTADQLVVFGEIRGRIRASSVQVHGTARIEGDIIHRTLSMEAAAKVNGLCRNCEEPRNYGEKPGGAEPVQLAAQRKQPTAV